MSAELTEQTEAEPIARRRSWWRGLLQAAIGLGALGFVFTKINLGDLTRAIARVDLLMLVWAVLLNLAMVYLMAARWRRLLGVKYPNIATGLLFRQYLIGLFFNLFTPGAIGGDLSRLLAVGTATGDRSFVFATLVVERLVGLCGLLIAGLFGIYSGQTYIEQPATYYIIATVMLIGLIFSGTIFNARATSLFISILSRLETKFKRNLGGSVISRLASELGIFGHRRGVIAASILFTLGIRLVWVLSCWVVARALGIVLPFSILMAFIAIVDVARMAPIALPNGIGVREYLLVLLLGQIGVPAAEALLFSLIAYTLLMLNGFIGGLIYTSQGAASIYSHKKAQNHKKEI